MVTLNLTLFVQLGLFLIFLWVTNALILRPVLRVLDDRDSTLDRNREDTETDTEQAQKLEDQVSKEMASARRAGAIEIEKARHDAMEERLESMTARKKDAEQAVNAVRADLTKQVLTQRAEYAPLVDTLAEDIAKRLRKGGSDQ